MSATGFSLLDSSELVPGQPLKAEDLDFYSLVRRQGDDGKIFFNRRRAVMFDVEAIGMLRYQLFATLGQTMAMEILFRFGYTQGYQDADSLANTYQWATDADWLTAGAALHKLAGMVSVEPQQLEFERETGHFLMKGIWRNSYEAENHLHHFGPNSAPVCWSLTGYASGYASRFFGQKLLAIETTCMGMGHEHCTWEIRPIAAWGAEAASDYLNLMDTIDLTDLSLQPQPRAVSQESVKNKEAEKALADEQNLLRAVIDKLPEQIYVKDRQSRFLLANEATRRVLGAATTEELVGKTDFDFSPRELAEQYYADEQQMFESGPAMIEIEEPIFNHETGDTHWLYSTKALFYDDEGNAAGLVGLNQDITERKLNEAKLARQATELQTVAEVSTSAAAITDPIQLLQEVVDLTKERFALYHAHIYLLDDHGETLNLVVGAGEVGHKMVEQGWSIRLSAEHSLVARTARMRAGTIVNNVYNEPDFFPNPLLPDTRAELAVPLIAGNHLLGVLDVQSDVLNHFTSEDLRIQTILAGQVAVALQNANQFQETQAALAITESLYQVTQFLSSADTVEELHQVAADNIGHTLAADRVTVCTIDLEANKVMGYALKGPGANRAVEPNRAIIFQEMQTGLAGLAIRNQETIISPGGEPDARESAEAQLARMEYDAASVVVVPIRLRGGQAGVITLSNRADQPDFRQDDIFFVENVANQLAITIENRSLLAGTRVALSETEALYRVGQSLAQMDDEQTMFEFVLSEYLRVIGLTQGGVLIFDDENSEYSTLKALMAGGKLVEAGLQVKMKGNPASEKVMRTKKPVVITDAVTDPLLESTRDFTLEMGYKSLLLVPIVVRGQVFGILGADSLETVHEFTEREIAFVQNMADQLGIAIENRRLLAETQVALAEVETTQQRYTVRAWEDYRNRRGGQRYEQVIGGVKPIGDKLPGEIIRVIENKQPMVFVGNSPELTEVDTRPLEPEAKSSLVVPLTVRNEIVGVLGLQETDIARVWTDEEVALVVTVAEQMSQAAESLRLLDESQQRAARELRVNEIGEKIRSAVSLDEALQIAVKEVGLSLKTPQTTVQLKMK